jgi:hypothetical protein
MPVRTRSRLNGFRILRDPKPRKLGHADSVLHMDGCYIQLSKTELALVCLLYRQVGQVIPYDRFCRILGTDCKRWKGLHLLREHMLNIRAKLECSGAPYVVTNAREFGYALCKIAPKRGTPLIDGILAKHDFARGKRPSMRRA